MQTKASEQDARLRAEQKASRAFRAFLAQYNDEQLPDEERAHKKLRIHTRGKKKSDNLLSRFFNSPIIQGALWSRAIESVADKTANPVPALAAHWPSIQEYKNNTASIEVDDTLAPDLGVAFAIVGVAAEVARRIEAEIDEVRMQDQIIARQYEQGFIGPFGAHMIHANLMSEFRLRHDALSDQYAHCIDRVDDIQRELGCEHKGGPCLVHVFSVIAPAGLSDRKPGISVAEAGAEMTVSDEKALEKAAPVIIVPPHLNFVP